MGVLRGALYVLATCLVAAAALAGGAAVQARPVGVVDASPRVLADMMRDIKWINPPKCQDARRAKSDPSWAVLTLTPNPPRKCRLYDGFTVIRKVNGSWRTTGIAASSTGCDAFRETLRKAGAPDSVYRDMRSAGYCEPHL